jgi:hypothetical protein
MKCKKGIFPQVDAETPTAEPKRSLILPSTYFG